jgi:chaperonin GroES
MSCSLQPIADRVLVKPDPEITKVGSIIVPDIAKVDATGYKTGEFVVLTGTVLAVGPGRHIRKGEFIDRFGGTKAERDFFRPTELKPGQRVQFRPCGDGRAGVELNVDGEDVLLMREDDVLAILEEQPKGRKRAAGR